MNTARRTLATLAVVALAALGACSTDTDQPEPSETVTVTAQPTPEPDDVATVEPETTAPAVAPEPVATTEAPAPVAPPAPEPAPPATPEAAFYAQLVAEYPKAIFATEAEAVPVGESVCTILDGAIANASADLSAESLALFGMTTLETQSDGVDVAMIAAMTRAATTHLCPERAYLAEPWLVTVGG